MVSNKSRDLEELKADIASRLSSACAHFPRHEFDDLVNQIAHVELKYARRIAPSSFEAL